jgi:hypothetical protein
MEGGLDAAAALRTWEERNYLGCAVDQAELELVDHELLQRV